MEKTDIDSCQQVKKPEQEAKEEPTNKRETAEDDSQRCHKPSEEYLSKESLIGMLYDMQDCTSKAMDRATSPFKFIQCEERYKFIGNLINDIRFLPTELIKSTKKEEEK